MKGKLYLIPNVIQEEEISNSIPADVQSLALSLNHFVVENVKVARRFLKKLDRTKDINECHFYSMGKHANLDDFPSYIKILNEGNDMGLISDAGCPAIADPGNIMVKLAHQNDIQVVPLVGPSSILLALMASGMNGQSFTFHGYLPHDQKERERKLKWIDQDARQNNHSHLFMDTPFRNNKLIEEVLQLCHNDTQLCVAASLTGAAEKVVSLPIASWKKTKYDFHKIPAMICLGKS